MLMFMFCLINCRLILVVFFNLYGRNVELIELLFRFFEYVFKFNNLFLKF